MRGKRRKEKFEAFQDLLEDLHKTQPLSEQEDGIEIFESLRIKTLQLLIPYLTPVLFRRALQVIWDIEYDYGRIQGLTELLSQLPESLLPEALQIVREIEYDYGRIQALMKLLPQFPEPLLPEALQIIREIEDNYSRAQLLRELLPQLSEPLLPEALQVIRGIENNYSRAQLLRELLPQSPKILPEAIQAIREIKDEHCRAQLLMNLLPQLPEISLEVLQAIREIKDSYDRDQLLRGLLPQLPESLLPEVFHVVREIKGSHNRAQLLRELIPRLPESLWPATLQAARGIYDAYDRFQLLKELLPQLPEVLLEALQAAREIDRGYKRVEALRGLLPQLPEILPEALQAAREIDRGYEHVEVLRELLFQLPESILPRALQIVREIENDYFRSRVLRELLPQLSKSLLPEALQIVREIEDDYNRSELLKELLPQLPEILPEALQTAREIKSKRFRAHALIELLPQLSEISEEVLQVVREIKDKRSRSRALMKLLSQLPECSLEVLQVSREIEDRDYRVQVLMELLPQLPKLVPEAILPEVLQAIWEIEDGYTQVRSIIKGRQSFDQFGFRTGGEAFNQFQFGTCRAQALESLILRLPTTALLKTFRSVQGLDDEYKRVQLLSYLTWRLPKELIVEVFSDVQKNEKLDNLSLALITWSLNFSSILPLQLLQGLLEIVLLVERWKIERVEILETTEAVKIAGGGFYKLVYLDVRVFLEKRILKIEPDLRYADLVFYFDQDRKLGARMPSQNALQVYQWSQLEVSVSQAPKGIPSEKRKRYPIHEPKQQDNVIVMVTAEGEGFEIAEPVQTLILPPKGDSTQNAIFRVRPLRASANCNDLAAIRIRTYYQFNLLEVDVIHAEVVGQFDNPSQSRLGLDKPITFKQERLEREYIDFDDIEPRSMHVDVRKQNDRFIFNFTFHNETDKKVEFTAPVNLPAADLEDVLLNFRQLWSDISMSQTFTTQLEGNDDDFLDNIRQLAKAGRNLWTKLFKHNLDGSMFNIGKWLEEHPLKPGAIIQVSQADEAADFVFPWALLYDQKVPRKEYELPDLKGFWGLRYCIEQRLPNASRITDQPIQIPDKLKLGFMLWEQFRNANKEKILMENLTTESAGKLEVTIPPITDVDDCF